MSGPEVKIAGAGKIDKRLGNHVSKLIGKGQSRQTWTMLVGSHLYEMIPKRNCYLLGHV